MSGYFHPCYFYPPHSYAPCYGGYYQGHPYQTQFSKVELTPRALQQGRRRPSSDLSEDASNLTEHMHGGIDKCSQLMESSKGASDNARKLGLGFDKFSGDFNSFADSATKFLGSITYPDFTLTAHPKETFNEVGVWKSMNEDFLKQLDKFSVLKYYENEDTSSTDCSCSTNTNNTNQNHWHRRNNVCGNRNSPPDPNGGFPPCMEPTFNYKLPPSHQWGARYSC